MGNWTQMDENDDVTMSTKKEEEGMAIPIYEVTKKLIGSVEPVGESNADRERLANLYDMIDVVEKLLTDIYSVAKCKACHQHSMREAGKVASNFIEEIKEPNP